MPHDDPCDNYDGAFDTGPKPKTKPGPRCTKCIACLPPRAILGDLAESQVYETAAMSVLIAARAGAIEQMMERLCAKHRKQFARDDAYWRENLTGAKR